ncbi:hypothetical protein FANTH_11611 [Fusarium anthophilum]|uniref:Uncharacterized protein n=1 Tax=Fusarium anthophilum TaxID=48485 RepID=A0A8H5DU81_9HYPO|nr:hypothetical protein FANTH_11611 [Fusarium anthophilum]
MSTCHALQVPNTQWNLCPSTAASILFLVLFAITNIAHLIQAIQYRSGYCCVIIMSAFWQVFTYIFRTVSIYNPASFDYYATWFVVILVAPLWTNAFAYMVFGRMVWCYTSDGRLYGIKAWQFGFIFVILDIIAFIVQVYGAAQAATGKDKTLAEKLDALHIYMGGVGLQLFFILVFAVFGIHLFRRLRMSNSGVDSATQKRSVMMLFYAMFFALALIVLRIIFRLIEYSQGLDSDIPRHEAYQYALDSLPMLIALVAFNVVHPARVMGSKEASMPKFWQRNKGHTEIQLDEAS